MKQTVTAVRVLVVLTLLTGAAYPAFMLLVGEALFPAQAGGSLLNQNGTVAGSALVAQKFTNPAYFWPRPSAVDYGTVASGASNQSPTSKTLLSAVAERRAALAGQGAENSGREMLFASGSGLDPEISPKSALAQIPRVMQARGISGEMLEALVKRFTQSRDLGFLGQERVNVLLLNAALDALTRK